MTLSKVESGFIIGAFPTICKFNELFNIMYLILFFLFVLGMIMATFFLSNIEVSDKVEAALQNFAAGLILAAVASELFPVLLEKTDGPSYIGITLGFLVALSLIYGLEALINFFENTPEDELYQFNIFGESDKSNKSTKNPILVKTLPKAYADLTDEDEHALIEMGQSSNEFVWQEDQVERASVAINIPQHRRHLYDHLEELMDIIKSMEDKSTALLTQPLTIHESENIAESIDEQTHSLQYKLDHCRRLLQGSESDVNHDTTSTGTSIWLNDDRKQFLQKYLKVLRGNAEHLVEHIQEPVLDRHVVQEMRIHMDHMDKQIDSFHDNVESVGAKWNRLLPNIETNIGDKLPLGLIIPVYMDAFVDGFLIGISSAISFKAGIILCIANCLEMSFLGMAYTSRLVKCTASSKLSLYTALYGPPLMMFLAAGLGAAIGSSAEKATVPFVAMVSFGAVALLFLVCNELLIEAREAQGEEDRWYISITVFAGIYLVLMMDHAF